MAKTHLEQSLASQNVQEQRIITEALQNVPLITNFAGVDLIEELQQNKGIEDDGVVLGGSLHCGTGGHLEDGIAIEDQSIHDSQLEHTLANDVFQNLLNPMQQLLKYRLSKLAK